METIAESSQHNGDKDLGETLLGTLLFVNSLTVTELEQLASAIGFPFETQFFQVYTVTPIRQISKDIAGEFIEKISQFRDAFLHRLQEYGTARTAHFRGEIFFVLNLDWEHRPTNQKTNRLLSEKVTREAVTLLQSYIDRKSVV